jgi:hypothetical protein
MKAFRLVLALAAILTATACSGDLTGPGTTSETTPPPPPWGGSPT